MFLKFVIQWRLKKWIFFLLTNAKTHKRFPVSGVLLYQLMAWREIQLQHFLFWVTSPSLHGKIPKVKFCNAEVEE